MITVIDKKRMIRHTKTKGSIYIRNLRYKKRIQNGELLISDEMGEKIISLIRGKTYPLSVKKIKHRMETELSIYDFNSHQLGQWLETRSELSAIRLGTRQEKPRIGYMMKELAEKYYPEEAVPDEESE